MFRNQWMCPPLDIYICIMYYVYMCVCRLHFRERVLYWRQGLPTRSVDAACSHKVKKLLSVTSWQDAHEIRKVHKTLLQYFIYWHSLNHKPFVCFCGWPPLSHSGLRRSQSLQGMAPQLELNTMEVISCPDFQRVPTCSGHPPVMLKSAVLLATSALQQNPLFRRPAVLGKFPLLHRF